MRCDNGIVVIMFYRSKLNTHRKKIHSSRVHQRREEGDKTSEAKCRKLLNNEDKKM